LQDLFAWAHRADTHSSPEEGRRVPCLFGLAPCGVYPALPLTRQPVRSYRTFSPLPDSMFTETGRYILCCTCRPDALKHPSRTLSGTLPCGVRTFLPLSTPASLTTCGAGGSDHPAVCFFSVLEAGREGVDFLREGFLRICVQSQPALHSRSGSS
jgi:hypothetical protein